MYLHAGHIYNASWYTCTVYVLGRCTYSLDMYWASAFFSLSILVELLDILSCLTWPLLSCLPDVLSLNSLQKLRHFRTLCLFADLDGSLVSLRTPLSSNLFVCDSLQWLPGLHPTLSRMWPPLMLETQVVSLTFNDSVLVGRNQL